MFPRDIVVGDGKGVVIIPAGIAAEIAAEAVEMTLFEDFVAERVAEGATIRGLYLPAGPATKPAFEAWPITGADSACGASCEDGSVAERIHGA